MKRIRLLLRVMRRTGADKIWAAFLVQFFLSALIIWRLEPDMNSYRESLWYCYAVVTTIGFGDVVAQHLLSRILSVLMSINAAVVIALITGVIVNYFNQMNALRDKETLSAFLEKLEHLPELSHEELCEIASRAREYQNK